MNNSKFYIWIHNSCGGRLKLNDKGMIRCTRYGLRGQFRCWPFNCGNHGDKECSVQGTVHELWFNLFMKKVNDCLFQKYVVQLWNIFMRIKKKENL